MYIQQLANREKELKEIFQEYQEVNAKEPEFLDDVIEKIDEIRNNKHVQVQMCKQLEKA